MMSIVGILREIFKGVIFTLSVFSLQFKKLHNCNSLAILAKHGGYLLSFRNAGKGNIRECKCLITKYRLHAKIILESWQQKRGWRVHFSRIRQLAQGWRGLPTDVADGNVTQETYQERTRLQSPASSCKI
jgi:hypothetical protein